MGHLRILDFLASKGASIDHRNRYKSSPLMAATVHCHPALIDALVKLDADKDAQDERGLTCLHHAAACGYAKIVRQLLAHGCTVAVLSDAQKLPVDLAVVDAVKAAFVDAGFGMGDDDADNDHRDAVAAEGEAAEDDGVVADDGDDAAAAVADEAV
jgi:ankyrin repeat protein